jgi:hypothetical protein
VIFRNVGKTAAAATKFCLDLEGQPPFVSSMKNCSILVLIVIDCPLFVKGADFADRDDQGHRGFLCFPRE